MRLFKRTPKKQPLPTKYPADLTPPDLTEFRYITDFFTRPQAHKLLARMATYHILQYGLSASYAQSILNRVGESLTFAGELSAAKNLPDGDTIVLYLALIYAHLTPPAVDPLFHTLRNAQLSKTELPRWKYSPNATLRVARAIKEYLSGDKTLEDQLLTVFARWLAAAPDKTYLRELTYQTVAGVMERSDYHAIFQRILPVYQIGEGAVLTELRQYFAGQSLYPEPSTAERWEVYGDYVQTPGVLKMRLHSVGSPDGADYDFALVNVPLLKKMRLALGQLELFINDSNAADAIEARKTMDAIYLRRPKLYQQWRQDKTAAKSFLEQGTINKTQYNTFKALWHKSRGLPWQHYGWKAGNLADLPASLRDLLSARQGGYNQIPKLLHTCVTRNRESAIYAPETRG